MRMRVSQFVKMLVDYLGIVDRDDFRDWRTVVGLNFQVAAGYGRIAFMSSHRPIDITSTPEEASVCRILEQILDHAQSSGLMVTLCAASSKDTNGGDLGSVMLSCLATVALCLKSSSAISKKQFASLSVLGHQLSSDGRMQSSMQPAAMLALALLSLAEISFSLISRTTTLSDHLTGPATDTNMTRWHGIRYVCVGLLDARLRWAGLLAVQQLCVNGAPKLLVFLLAAGISNTPQERTVASQVHSGSPPEAVVWTVSSICQCLSDDISMFLQVLIRLECIKCIVELVSDAHLKFARSWNGAGGRKFGVGDTINVVVDLLMLSFVAVLSAASQEFDIASVHNGFLLNMGSSDEKFCAEDEDMMNTIQANMKMCIQFLLEVEVTTFTELIIARLVAVIAKLSTQKPLVVQLVSKGLLDPTEVQKFLNSPEDVNMDFHMLVSYLTRKDKVIIPSSPQVISVFHAEGDVQNDGGTEIMLSALCCPFLIYSEKKVLNLDNFENYMQLAQHLVDYMVIPIPITQIPLPRPPSVVRRDFPFLFGMFQPLEDDDAADDDDDINYIIPLHPPRPEHPLAAPPLTPYVGTYTHMSAYCRMVGEEFEFWPLGEREFSDFRRHGKEIVFILW